MAVTIFILMWGGAGHASDSIYIGDTEAGNNEVIMMGNVGIGAASPAMPLHVEGNMQASMFYDKDDNTYYVDPASTSKFGRWVGIGTTSPVGQLHVGTDDLVVTSGGNVGIGTTDPQYSLTVNGDLCVDTPTFHIESATNQVFIGKSGSLSMSDSAQLSVHGILNLTNTSAFNDPTSTPNDGICLWACDTGFQAELKVLDENGNQTTLSPHNFSISPRSEDMAWSYYSENRRIGKKVNVDMLKAIRLLERTTGEKLVYMSNLSGKKAEDPESIHSYREHGKKPLREIVDELIGENQQLKDMLSRQNELILRLNNRLNSLEQRK